MNKIRKKLNQNLPTLGENFNSKDWKHSALVAVFIIFIVYLIAILSFDEGTLLPSYAADATETVTPLTDIYATIGFKYCSAEGRICSFPGTALVAFEAFPPGGGQVEAYQLGQFTNSVSCSSSVFGLFKPGYYKACFYKLLSLTPTPLPSTSCTDSDGGYNIYSTGKTNFSYAGRPWVFDEVCLTPNSLAESSCDGNLMKASAVTCPNGYYCKGDSWSGACVPGTPTPPPPTPNWCKDSDGLDIFNKGKVDFFRSGNPAPYYQTDGCQNGVVLENFCDSDNHARTQSIACPNGYSCQNGACVSGAPTPTPPPPNSCTDSDGGYNIYAAGKVNSVYYGQNSFNSDACVSSSLLQENYCDTGIPKYLAITCQKGCANGACISGDSPTPTPTPTAVPTPTSISSPSASLDSDGDGFTNAVEIYIGTNPNLKCGINAWPPDFNNDGNVTNLDSLSFSPSFNSKAGDAKYDKRHDLNADRVVSLSDVLKLSPYFNKSCTP